MITSHVDDHDLFEPYAALLRQTTSRAVERLRRRREALPRASRADDTRAENDRPYYDNHGRGGGDRSQRSASSQPISLRPIDILVIQYCMYYVDLTHLPDHHYLKLACEVVTGSVDRVRYPRYFSRATSLPQLCEQLTAEYTAEVMQSTLAEVESFVEIRTTLAAWIDEHTSHDDSPDGANDEDDEDDDDEDDDVSDSDENEAEEKDMKQEGEEKEEEGEGKKASARERRRLRRQRQRRRHRRWIESVEDEQHRADKEQMLDLAGALYHSLEFWLRVYDFIHALASGTAQMMNRFDLHPRYERELLELLHRVATRPRRVGGDEVAAYGRGAQTTRHGGETFDNRHTSSAELDAAEAEEGAETGPMRKAAVKSTAAVPPARSDSVVVASTPLPLPLMIKKEDAEDRGYTDSLHHEKDEYAPPLAGEKDILVQQRADQGNDDDDDDDDDDDESGLRDSAASAAAPREAAEAVVVAVLADSLALSQVTPHHPLIAHTVCGTHAVWDGVSADYYAMIHARLAVMTARDRLHRYGRRARLTPPALTESQSCVLRAMQEEEEERQRQLSMRSRRGAASTNVANMAESGGLPLDFVPSDRYYAELMARQSDFVEEDEELYKDEVVDYYLRKGAASRQSRAAEEAQQRGSAEAGRWGSSSAAVLPSATTTLVKPHRFCKVKTGFTWTQYNRTHYDSHTNPPPRTVMWYEFTLFYPALVHTKRNMRNIFHIEDTPRGPQDDYCLLVFSVGPPYADVAYRIVRKQWDTRRGGVRISFDATGRYKLFFRFTNSNYRR